MKKLYTEIIYSIMENIYTNKQQYYIVFLINLFNLHNKSPEMLLTNEVIPMLAC